MSTINPTPPTGAGATKTTTVTARLISGAEALSEAQPGNRIQAQITNVTAQGQVSLSMPGGEATLQLISRAPATLKPGDIYVLQTGPRGSDTVTLAQTHLAANTPPPLSSGAESTETDTPGTLPPRNPGVATVQLVSGTVTTAIIIPRPAGQPPTAPLTQPFIRQASQTQVTTTSAPTGSQSGSSQAVKPGAPAPSGADTYLHSALAAARAISDDATSQRVARPAEPRPSGTPAISVSANTTAGGSAGLQTITPDQPGQTARAPGAQTNQPTTQKIPTVAGLPQFSGSSPVSVENGTNQPSRPPHAPQAYKPPQAQAAALTRQPTQTDTKLQASTGADGQTKTTGTDTGTTTVGVKAPTAAPTMIERAEIRILSVQLPGASTTSNAVTQGRGSVFTGTVVGTSSSGQTILTTPQGLMTIAGGADLPAGTRLAVERIDQPTHALNQPFPPPPAPLTHLAQHWETLDQTLRLLEMANPAVANQLTQNHVARPGPQLTAAILLFMAAVRGGDLRAWLGDDAARAIEHLRVPVAGTLAEEFTTMQRASEPAESGWRGFFIPLLDEGQLNQIRLFLHQDRDTAVEDGDESATNTHFLVDLSLRAIGDLQIDGMVKPETVDLLIRSREALPDSIRQNIREIFTNTLARTGINGQIAFRAQKNFPDLPFKPLEGYQDGSNINI